MVLNCLSNDAVRRRANAKAARAYVFRFAPQFL
jgi:hypothetical protein